MGIRWDRDRNEWLVFHRDISFEEVSDKILNKRYIDIIENPARDSQQCVVMEIRDYVWVVPFVIDKDSNIILKTAYLSRKLNRKYGGGR